MAATNREKVLAHLIERPYQQVSVTTLSEETGLTRRQTITALHGLKTQGLETQLGPSGSGHWIYAPPLTESVEPRSEDTVEFVPVGWETRIRVIARFGERYLIGPVTPDGEDTGLRVWATPVIGGIEYLPGQM